MGARESGPAPSVNVTAVAAANKHEYFQTYSNPVLMSDLGFRQMGVVKY